MILSSMTLTGINPDGHSACRTVFPMLHPGIWDIPTVIPITLPGIAGRIMIPGTIHLMEVTGVDTIRICTVITVAIMMAIITEVVIPIHTIAAPHTTDLARLSKTTGLPGPVAQEASAGKMPALQVLQE
jgi:hypothetical protein